MGAPLVDRNTGDIIPAADHNDVKDYVEDAQYRINTQSLQVGGKQVVNSDSSLVGFVDINRFGFVNRTETSISFDGTDTFTLIDNGSGWSYYRNGLKCTISGNKTKQVASPMVDGTLYYIFIDDTDGTLSSATSAWTLNDTKVVVATVYWDNTLTPKFMLADERHTCTIDRTWHREHHLAEGTQYITPGTVTGLTPASDTDSDKTFGISGVQIVDEDLFFTIAELADPDGATPTYYNLYRTGATTYAWEISDMPFKYTTSAGPAYGFIEYDNAGTSTQSAANRFVNTYIFVSNDVANNEANPEITTGPLRYFVVQGRGSYTSATAAYGESFASFNLTGFPIVEGICLYQITWATTNRPDTVKGRCRYVSTQRITANITSTSIVATASHNTLTGLQGGTLNEYYHLTSAQHSVLDTPYDKVTTGNTLSLTDGDFSRVWTLDNTDTLKSAGLMIIRSGSILSPSDYTINYAIPNSTVTFTNIQIFDLDDLRIIANR